MASEIPGQIKFTDEEMGFSVPVKSLDAPPSEAQEVTEDTETKLTDEERDNLYKLVLESKVTDPSAKGEDEMIGLLDLLDRELTGSVHMAKNLGALAHITVSRVSEPEELRALAVSVLEHHTDSIQKQINALRKEQDELWKRYDAGGGSNPRFQQDNINIIRQIEPLEEEKKEKARTANEIAYFLKKLADAVEKQAGR